MPTQRVATVLFDWDGTLCDSGAAGMRAFRQSLAEFGIGFTDVEYKAVYTPSWYKMYQAFGLSQALWDQADQRWLHHYRGEEPGLIPGASEVLALLGRRGLQLGIVTSGTRNRIEREIARLGLTSTFQAIVCHEDVTRKKPDPEGIEKALALVNSAAAACWYLGDTPEDIRMGKSARVFTLGLLTEYVDACRLEECGPDLVLRTIEDLHRFLPV